MEDYVEEISPCAYLWGIIRLMLIDVGRTAQLWGSTIFWARYPKLSTGTHAFIHCSLHLTVDVSNVAASNSSILTSPALMVCNLELGAK